MGSQYKVLLYEAMHERGIRLLEEKCDLIYAQKFDPDHIISLAGEVEGIIIRARGEVSAAVIEAAPRLRVIGRHGVGLESIDLTAARAKGVRVVYTPTANSQSVAEHFVGLAIILAKKIRLADLALRRAYWPARYELIGTELGGKTLGVLGFGRIGQATARICRHGFRMPVLYYDVTDYPEAEAELDARRVDLPEVFSRADLISVNLPLTKETRGLVKADLISLMKPTAFLINMARGPIWNEADLVQALRAGRIAGVGSDVFEEEPIDPDHPFFDLDNFVGTPHMSAHTEEAMIKMSLVAQDVLAVLEGGRPRFPVPGT